MAGCVGGEEARKTKEGSVPLASMTGYGRAEGRDAATTWAWEVRSVNGRSLEIRCRVPPGYDRLEAAARAALAAGLRRGNVTAQLTVNRVAQAAPFRINQELLQNVMTVLGDLQRRAGATPPSADGLLRIRGIVDAEEDVPEAPETIQAREAAMVKTLDDAVRQLQASRMGEGGRLATVLEGHLAAIAELCERAARCAAAQPGAIRERLHRQLQELLGNVPALSEERFAQEVALLIQKADVREELDRLAAHVAAARELVAGADGTAGIGRKFDFLCQEFNREANTLCSKAGEIELTRLGIELKSAVEQLREQVQNVE